jgi:diadenosine tetraphosphate (Ap4A) HIT family hydrolase
MPDQSVPETGECAFCDPEATRAYRLHEGRDFYVIADHAPVAEAHLLLIPRQHYPHLAALPPELDAEFHALKSHLGDYVRSHYGRLTYWENGVFGQSVPHAHLHTIAIEMDTTLFEHQGEAIGDLPSMRSQWRQRGGHYFMVEHEGIGRLMPPDPDLYVRIIRHARERNGGMWRYAAPERKLHAQPVVEAMIARWRKSAGHVSSTEQLPEVL